MLPPTDSSFAAIDRFLVCLLPPITSSRMATDSFFIGLLLSCVLISTIRFLVCLLPRLVILFVATDACCWPAKTFPLVTAETLLAYVF
jgi:hypothetical protein